MRQMEKKFLKFKFFKIEKFLLGQNHSSKLSTCQHVIDSLPMQIVKSKSSQDKKAAQHRPQSTRIRNYCDMVSLGPSWDFMVSLGTSWNYSSKYENLLETRNSFLLNCCIWYAYDMFHRYGFTAHIGILRIAIRSLMKAFEAKLDYLTYISLFNRN